MIVQFNLLPDVKVEYLKARKQQHVVSTIAIIASVVALTILALSLFTVYGVQRKLINDLTEQISQKSTELQSTKDLSKILTIQGQLNSLPSLHEKKVVSTRLFGYLSKITPSDVSIAQVSVDYNTKKMSLSGNAKDLAQVNKFVDTIKFTTYTAKNGQGTEVAKDKAAFTSVVLAGFNRDMTKATYNITLNFEADLFDETKTVELKVPNTITTRSEVNKPADLFQETTGGTN